VDRPGHRLHRPAQGQPDGVLIWGVLLGEPLEHICCVPLDASIGGVEQPDQWLNATGLYNGVFVLCGLCEPCECRCGVCLEPHIG